MLFIVQALNNKKILLSIFKMIKAEISFSLDITESLATLIHFIVSKVSILFTTIIP